MAQIPALWERTGNPGRSGVSCSVEWVVSTPGRQQGNTATSTVSPIDNFSSFMQALITFFLSLLTFFYFILHFLFYLFMFLPFFSLLLLMPKTYQRGIRGSVKIGWPWGSVLISPRLDIFICMVLGRIKWGGGELEGVLKYLI